ncbi:carbohydrate ABC transporter permease, partial [Marinovum sp. 1_MG-2023]|nr:carbohydrate ABC transporter permease [Marinovum sp. 1_MG-2023]
DTAELKDGARLTVAGDGAFRLTGVQSWEGQRLPRVFTTAATPPEFTLSTYTNVLTSDTAGAGIASAGSQSLTGARPATSSPSGGGA